MPDYDVEAVGLATPPASAPVTTYRPAVSVRNNGLYPADITGYLRMYRKEPPGELMATWQLSLDSLGPGNTGNAAADGYWTPTIEEIGQGRIFQGYVTAPLDQLESNNNLPPVVVTISAGEPPPPPPVEAHASQHEDGGSDELVVDGLSGVLVEPQPPTQHSGQHEEGGSDELAVNGLHGQLADPQTPSGHGNEVHTEDFLSAGDLANHNTSALAHVSAPQLVHTTEKGTINGVCPLDGSAKVNQNFLYAHAPEAHAASHQNAGSDELNVAGLSGQLADAQMPIQHDSADHFTLVPVRVAPGFESAIGANFSVNMSDHVHSSPGAVASLSAPVVDTGGMVAEIIHTDVPAPHILPGLSLTVNGFARIDNVGVPHDIHLTLEGGPAPGALTYLAQVYATLFTGVTYSYLWLHGRVHVFLSGGTKYAAGCISTHITEDGPNWQADAINVAGIENPLNIDALNNLHVALRMSCPIGPAGKITFYGATISIDAFTQSTP